MSQRQVMIEVTGLNGDVQLLPVSIDENHHRESEMSIERLVNEGEIDMNDIIPSGSESHMTSGYHSKPHLEETGVHPLYERNGLKTLERYQARREESIDIYSSE